MMFLLQDEHQTMYGISLLKYFVVVLSKSERSGWLPAVQMCTELLVQLMSVSLSRNLTGKVKIII
jgi:hypothetical protein